MSTENTDKAGQHEIEPPAKVITPPGGHPASDEVTRRAFLSKVSVALGGATAAILGGPVIAFLVAPLFRKPPETWRSVGKVSDFQTGNTVQVTFEEASPLPWAGVTARTAAWLRKVSDTEFVVFSVQCTHLGCPVTWLEGARLFMCPCHGGVYYPDGRVAAGPPPKPLPRYQVRVRDGEVELLVSEKPESPDLSRVQSPDSKALSQRERTLDSGLWSQDS